MASPTTLRGELLKVKKGFNDRNFLTLDGDAGISPYNPMLLGIGIRLIVQGNENTRSVRFELTRIVDDEDAETVVLYPVQTSQRQWELEGAVGGVRLSFPQNVNYYTPQCFRLDMITSNISQDVTSTYYFWVAEGPSGSVIPVTDRIMSATGPFACCYQKPDSQDYAPIVQFGLPDPLTTRFDDGDPRNGTCGDDFFATLERVLADGVYDHAHLIDPVRGRPMRDDPFSRLTEAAVPATLTLRELFTNGYGEAYLHVIGDDELWHRERFAKVAPTLAVPLPGDTAGDIPDDYADGPSIISVTPLPSTNDGIAVLDGQPFLVAAQDAVAVGANVIAALVPPVSLAGSSYDVIVMAGIYATYTGAGTAGVEYDYESGAPGPFAKAQTSVNRMSDGKVYAYSGIGTWGADPTPVVINSSSDPLGLIMPMNFGPITTGDIIAIQAFMAPAGTLVTDVSVLWESRFPIGAAMSNLIKVEIL